MLMLMVIKVQDLQELIKYSNYLEFDSEQVLEQDFVSVAQDFKQVIILIMKDLQHFKILAQEFIIHFVKQD